MMKEHGSSASANQAMQKSYGLLSLLSNKPYPLSTIRRQKKSSWQQQQTSRQPVIGNNMYICGVTSFDKTAISQLATSLGHTAPPTAANSNVATLLELETIFGDVTAHIYVSVLIPQVDYNVVVSLASQGFNFSGLNDSCVMSFSLRTFKTALLLGLHYDFLSRIYFLFLSHPYSIFLKDIVHENHRFSRDQRTVAKQTGYGQGSRW